MSAGDSDNTEVEYDWFKPIQNPTTRLLGFGAPPRKPVAAPRAAPVPTKKVTIEDIFVRNKPKEKQVKARNGEFLPDTMRGRVLVMLGHITNGDPTKHVKDGRLVVDTWQRWPEVYSISGYRLPDAAKVRAKLCGPEGLIGRGYVRRIEEGLYCLTKQGAEWWQQVGRPWLATQTRT